MELGKGFDLSPVLTAQCILELGMTFIFGHWEMGKIRHPSYGAYEALVEHDGKWSRSLATGTKKNLRVGGSVRRSEQPKKRYSKCTADQKLLLPWFSEQVFTALPQILEVRFPAFSWLGRCQMNDFNSEITWGDSIQMYLHKLKLKYQNYLVKMRVLSKKILILKNKISQNLIFKIFY